MDSEKILIGGWLLKEHLEDLDKVQPSDFSYFPSVVKAIKEHGANLLKVKYALNLPITDLTEMTGLYQPVFYRDATVSYTHLERSESALDRRIKVL